MADTTTPEPIVIHQLSYHKVQQLEKTFPQIAIPKTELEAGYLLGVQAVLKKLRDGF